MAETAKSLAGRIGAYALHSQYDSKEITQAARTAFLAKFIAQVDPNLELPEEERLRRAEHALREHMARLAMKSAKARAAKKAGKS